MLQVQRGKVKFFLVNNGWGFIIPDDGGPEVMFHVEYFSGLSEFYDGELTFEFQDDATLVDYRVPKQGNPVVYETIMKPKGPFALHWMHADTLTRAEKILANRRGSPDNCFVRVMKFGPEEMLAHRPSVFWKGTDQEFRRKLDEGFPEMFDEDYFVEKLGIDSKWERIWHPSGWHKGYMRSGGGKLP